MFRRVTAVIGMVITVMLISGCTPTGDSFAASLAERVIIGIGDDITPPYPKPEDAERLAAEAISDPRLPHLEAPVDYDIDVIGWERHSGDADGAKIEIRRCVRAQFERALDRWGELRGGKIDQVLGAHCLRLSRP